MTGITITPTSILITYRKESWTIDRADGSITPATNYIPITDCDNGLSVSCANYASYYRKIPQKLRSRWVETMIRWRDVKLNMFRDWETWLAWLDYIDPNEFHDSIMTYSQLGEYLFPASHFHDENIAQIRGDIADVMIEMRVIPDPTVIEGIRSWVALAGREQVEFLLMSGCCGFYLYLCEKFKHHDDFSKVRNIWHDFCKVMERRANENAVSCDQR